MGSYNYQQLTRKLRKIGFRLYRQGKGSHTLWVNDATGAFVPVPNHGGKDVRKGTLRNIVKQVGLKTIRELDRI